MGVLFPGSGVPLAALIITMLGVWVAARQMLIANEKVSLDRFNSQYERRFAVYDATRSILEKSASVKQFQKQMRVYMGYACWKPGSYLMKGCTRI